MFSQWIEHYHRHPEQLAIAVLVLFLIGIMLVETAPPDPDQPA